MLRNTVLVHASLEDDSDNHRKMKSPYYAAYKHSVSYLWHANLRLSQVTLFKTST